MTFYFKQVAFFVFLKTNKDFYLWKIKLKTTIYYFSIR